MFVETLSFFNLKCIEVLLPYNKSLNLYQNACQLYVFNIWTHTYLMNANSVCKLLYTFWESFQQALWYMKNMQSFHGYQKENCCAHEGL